MKTNAKSSESGRYANKYMFGICIILLLFLISISFFAPDWKDTNSLLFRILLGISVGYIATFLTGFLKLKIANIEAAGGLAVFLFVCFFNPLESKPVFFNTKLNLNSIKGESINEGTIHFSIEGNSFSQNKQIESNGEVSITDIPSKLRNSKVRLTLESNKFKLLYPDSLYDLTEKIAVSVTPILVERIFGRITTSTNQSIENAKVEVKGVSTLTNKNGEFKIEIPKVKQSSKVLLSAQKQGYSTSDDKEKYEDEIDIDESKVGQYILLKKIHAPAVESLPASNISLSEATSLPIKINNKVFIFPFKNTVKDLKIHISLNIINEQSKNVNQCYLIRFGQTIDNENLTLEQAGFTSVINQLNMSCNGGDFIYLIKYRHLRITGISDKIIAVLVNGIISKYEIDGSNVNIMTGFNNWDSAKNTIELFGSNKKIKIANLKISSKIDDLIEIDGKNGALRAIPPES
ncbi:CS1-pili formation C-terminal domain-containing protein [Runella aurantiaca]|nr:CS1-pili formation C-terminal domain-containing protein [Runella aurantiaca]